VGVNGLPVPLSAPRPFLSHQVQDRLLPLELPFESAPGAGILSLEPLDLRHPEHLCRDEPGRIRGNERERRLQLFVPPHLGGQLLLLDATLVRSLPFSESSTVRREIGRHVSCGTPLKREGRSPAV